MEAASLSEALLSQSPGCPQFSHKRAERESDVMPLHGTDGFHLASLQTRSAVRGG